MKKPIIHLINFTSRPGGIEVLVPIIANSLNNYNYNCYVFVIRPPKLNRTNVYNDYKISITYGHSSNLRAMIKLWKYSRNHRNEIFHLFDSGPFFLNLLILAGVKNIIYSIHGIKYWDNGSQRLLQKLFWNIAFFGKLKIIANSVYSMQCFKQATGYKGHVEVIYNPIDIYRFSAKNRIYNSDFKKVIYSGRLDPGKNLFRWFDVAKTIHEHYPNIIFELYGEGNLENELKVYVNDLGLHEVVEFKGFRKDIENVYREADLLLFLSEYESFGNVVVESILCGTPVIASAIPSMKEIFKNFPDFLVDLDDQLEKIVLNKIRQIEQLRLLVKPAQEEFRERFSLQNHLDSLDKVYQSYLSE